MLIVTEEKLKGTEGLKRLTNLPRKKAKYTIGVKALTNLRINVLKMSLSSKLLSVFGTSRKDLQRVSEGSKVLMTSLPLIYDWPER